MGEAIAVTDIKREKDYLYYVGTDSEGYLTLNKALLTRGRVKGALGRKTKLNKPKIEKKDEIVVEENK